MTKKDLKNGMIVELRNGTRYLYCEGVFIGLNEWDLISNYTDNLKIPEFPQLDIVKVYEDTKEYDLSTIFEYEFLRLIWQRPETLKLSEREIKILKALDVLGFKYIARDKNEELCAFQNKPRVESVVWTDDLSYHKLEKDLFSFIKWENKEPTNILKLLSIISLGGK